MNDLIKTLLTKVEENACLDINRLKKEKRKLAQAMMTNAGQIEEKEELIDTLIRIKDLQKNKSVSEDKITEMIEDLVL